MLNGGARPDRDYPRLIADIRSGRINVRDQLSAVWRIDRIEEAIAALKAGEVTPAVLDHDR